MASAYILFSEKLNRFYIGSCVELGIRLAEHQNKKFVDSFTSRADDWIVFLTIENLGYKQARAIEKHIKKMKSVVYINNLKKYPEMIAKLTEKYNVF
ncbi:MAG: GIY-YIG nuclease family protein [Chitinophagaceae bacterium]|nr:MAG: GIY-YIG nuclease family protein [Chitinophagaceae bacterium]